MRNILLILLLMSGCCSPKKEYKQPSPNYEPWDTSYLIVADVEHANVDAAVAEREQHLKDYAEVLGVLWQPLRSHTSKAEPDMYDNGGDNAIFSGMLLAARSWKYGVTNDYNDLQDALRTLDGIYLLTHADGPGSIARCAFPKFYEEKFGYPEAWQSRIDSGFVGESKPMVTPRGTALPATIYYTRATKDQLTGLVFGLSVAWNTLSEAAKPTIAQITFDLVKHLNDYDWKIRDYTGMNDTNADDVSGLQKTQLLALYRHTSSYVGDTAIAEKAYKDNFQIEDAGDAFGFGNNLSQYFAWNLRYTRAFTVWLLADDENEKAECRRYVREWLWPHTEDHQNAWFTLIYNVITGRVPADEAFMFSMKSLSVKPIRCWASPYAGQTIEPSAAAVASKCTGEWVLPPHLRKPAALTWTKFPWDTGSPDTLGLLDDNGLSLILPYWGALFYE